MTHIRSFQYCSDEIFFLTWVARSCHFLGWTFHVCVWCLTLEQPSYNCDGSSTATLRIRLSKNMDRTWGFKFFVVNNMQNLPF